MTNIKVGFTGTREGMADKQYPAFIDVMEAYRPSEFHHGDCIGSDLQAVQTIVFCSWPCKIFSHPPTDSRLRGFSTWGVERPAKSYLVRDRDIVDESDMLVATPRSNSTNTNQTGGTWYTVRYALKVGKPVTVILMNGEIVELTEATRP